MQKPPVGQPSDLEMLAAQLGELEDKAFRLDQGHVSYLIAVARQDLQQIIRRAGTRPVVNRTFNRVA